MNGSTMLSAVHFLPLPRAVWWKFSKKNPDVADFANIFNDSYYALLCKKRIRLFKWMKISEIIMHKKIINFFTFSLL